MIAGALLLAALASPAPPIELLAEPAAGGVRLTVIGLAREAYRAGYTLEVTGTGAAGASRTRQHGRATLRPGERTVLLSVSLAGGAATWRAELTVAPAEGAPYCRLLTGAAGPHR